MVEPRLLLVDTSGSSCSVALSEGERLLGEYILSHGRVRSASLLSAADSLLRETGLDIASLDAIAVTTGPGSFTGLRVGLATVKGIALAAGKNVIPLSSLAVLALNLPHSQHPVCPMFDARKKEVYAALYETREGLCPVIPESVSSAEDFLARIPGEAVFLGDGARTYRDTICSVMGRRARFAPASFDVPRPSSAIPLALGILNRGETIPPDLLLPSYIRLSEAELAKINGKL
jgi:tRNA threonylcarbamoyladenosine biosynthesis protein TsaB